MILWKDQLNVSPMAENSQLCIYLSFSIYLFSMKIEQYDRSCGNQDSLQTFLFPLNSILLIMCKPFFGERSCFSFFGEISFLAAQDYSTLTRSISRCWIRACALKSQATLAGRGYGSFVMGMLTWTILRSMKKKQISGFEQC